MRVLVIDDDPPSRQLAEYLLRNAGHTVVTASSAPEGMSEAKTAAYDVVLSSVFMHDIDGCTLAKELKSDDDLRETRLVAVTALAMTGDKDRILAAGFDGYVSKPVDPSTFVADIELLSEV